MSDLFIIVTRMTGTGENEFNGYFNNRNWAAKYNQNTTCRIPSEQSDLLYDDKDLIIFVNGFSVKNHDGKCKALKRYISSGNERNIYMLIHPGVDLTLEQANQRIFKCNNVEQESIPQKLEIQEYSSKFTVIKGIVEHLAKCINENNPGTICHTDKIKDYILKKKRDPIVHLFLPLDIDMQALEILSKRPDKSPAVEYLREMCASAEDGFYSKKWDPCRKDVQNTLDQMPDGENKNNLRELINVAEPAKDYLCNFLLLLDSNKGKQISQKDVEAVIGFFKTRCNDGVWKKIHSFHNWYSQLAACPAEFEGWRHEREKK